MKELIKNRDIFISKRAYFSHSSYAYAQLKRCVGKNKKVHGKEKFFDEKAISKLKKLFIDGKISEEWIENRYCKSFLQFILKDLQSPIVNETNWKTMDIYLEDEDIVKIKPPRKKDFCYIIPNDNHKYNQFPGRNIPLAETGINLDQYNCSSVEHIGHMYRLYYYGNKAKGVFRNGQIVCESIPIEDEDKKFIGLLTFSSNEYEQSKKDYHSYYEWMLNRNETRWIDQENKIADFDSKHMAHTIRLLLSGENILINGKPIVRFYGEQLKFLRDIRENKYNYDYLLKFAENKLKELDELFEKSTLPDSPNIKKLSALYDELISMNEK